MAALSSSSGSSSRGGGGGGGGGAAGGRLATSGHQMNKPASFASPEKVRELLSDGVPPADGTSLSSIQGSLTFVEASATLSPCEATNEESFLSRVESFSCLRWAGKPRTLSPLKCAQYGWVNVSVDMLKCFSCHAFLCASLSPTLDLEKYESRIAEISRQLQTQHEKFCPWPDFPSPERFWLVPASDPTALLRAFLARFQSTCLLEQQLPAIKPEQLKSMSLTEDMISVLLQLIEGEQKKQGVAPSSDALGIQMAACIVSLCGWAASPAVKTVSLPILTCSFCMRRVGLWNFHQMEGAEDEVFQSSPSPTATQAPGPVAATVVVTPAAPVAQEGQGRDTSAASPTPTSSSPPPTTPSTPSTITTPSRMKLRSQDTTRSDQADSPLSSLALLRARSKDSPGPVDEPLSPLTRGKRQAAATRSRGQDGASSPQNTPKRIRLSSAGGPDGPLQRNAFDPLAQHRDWCPWVNAVKEAATHTGAAPLPGEDSVLAQQGWKAALDLLLPMKKNSNQSEGSLAQSPQDKSKRVFAILRQWQASAPSQ